MHCDLPSVFGLASWIWSRMWTCDTSFGNLDNLSRWRQVDSNPAPHACAPCAGMMSYPNSRRPTTVWYESSVISILTPSPSTGHISALRCRLLEILGALQSSQWVLFSNDWIYRSLIRTRTVARSGFPPLAAHFTLLQYAAKSSKGQGSLIRTAAPGTNSLANPPKIHIANSIHLEEHPTENNQQSRYKPSLL